MDQGVVPGGENSGVVLLTKSGTTHYHVPAGELWLLSWAVAFYVADATVATRYARLKMHVDGTSVSQASLVLCGGSITASQAKQYQFGPGLAGGTLMDKDNAMIGSPLVMPAGAVLEFSVDAGAPAGDDWSVWCHYFRTRTEK